MNKNEFLKIIREGLNDFPSQELDEIIYDYEQHFRDAMSDGKTEEEIIGSLGDPFVIVNQYRSGYVQSVPQYKNNRNNSDDYKTNNSYDYAPPRQENNNSNTINTILKIAIAIFALILIGPIGITVVSVLFALVMVILVIPFTLSLSGIALLLGKSGLSLFGFAVPSVLADFPTSVIALATTGSIAATILVTILSLYCIKAVILLIKKLYNKFFTKGVQ